MVEKKPRRLDSFSLLVRSPLRLALLPSLLLACGVCLHLQAQTAGGGATLTQASSASRLAWQAETFRNTASVLYVAAHPDDENTHLITALVRGRAVRTAYLSLTRGDGGQNESGPDFGERLGLARTHELLAARALDGGQQYFTRALDFGYSKSVEETLRFWNREAVLADVVRVIREFRPDVIITRFSPEGGGTHGHHTASAVLALEAFKLAGDPGAFPDQLATLQPWQPRRILQNLSPWNPQPASFAGPVFKIEGNGRDPVTGLSLAAIAAQSRAQHITQGFANFGAGAKPDESRPEALAVLAGEPTEKDPLEGVDSSWSRYPGGATLQAKLDAWAALFDAAQPEASLPALLELRRALLASEPHPDLMRKREELDRLLTACLGLTVETRVDEAWLAPGDTTRLHHQVRLAHPADVTWVGVDVPEFRIHKALQAPLAGASAACETTLSIPREQPLSHPYWLGSEPQGGLFKVSDDRLIGAPVNPPVAEVEFVFAMKGQRWIVRDEPRQAVATPHSAQTLKRLEIVAPVSAAFAEPVSLFAPGETKLVNVELTARHAGVGGSVRLQLPEGFTAIPEKIRFSLVDAGQTGAYGFKVTAPRQQGRGEIRVAAEVEGRTYGNSRDPIQYRHLPVLLLQAPARQTTVVLDVSTTARRIGYLPGAGDDTVAALRALGCEVTMLTEESLVEETLAPLDAVVLGVRAFNERPKLREKAAALFAYAERGGTVIVQYNRPNGLQDAKLAPYALSIQGDAPSLRVTDEGAPVGLLAPEHPALRRPNAITVEDFSGWVQERGAYFPKTWDEQAFVPLLAMYDPGEAPLRGSLLIARHGRGHFVYTGLAFFRQLPAGVPGAYRLFANLLSLSR